MAAVFTDNLIRYQTEGFKPRRDIKLALTCGEETPETFNSVDWLIRTHPEALRAAFALNEGAVGELDLDGKPTTLQIQAGEKAIPGLHARDDPRRWAQCATGTGQRHLSAGCRFVAVVGVAVSDQPQPCYTGLFRSPSEIVAKVRRRHPVCAEGFSR